MESAFKIHSMEEYLNFYMEETERLFFKEEFPELKEKILANCFEIKRAIQEINHENFFEQYARINTLEAEILIILECSELRGSDNVYRIHHTVQLLSEPGHAYPGLRP